ncbi:Poly [ADP-ribose] polymerase [Aix galericulata]|nr:Poly [ADP-ribose] polymerase [Aix galericulata]
MWDAMQTQQLKVVELKPVTKDYREAAERFLKTTRLLKHEKASTTQQSSYMRAANFGNGMNFAVNASYSAHNIHYKRDVDGKKYMHMARVLVGECSQEDQLLQQQKVLATLWICLIAQLITGGDTSCTSEDWKNFAHYWMCNNSVALNWKTLLFKAQVRDLEEDNSSCSDAREVTALVKKNKSG